MLSHSAFAAPADGPLVILHMNVGQGDATLVIAPSGETLLIDGGDKGRGRKVVIQRLRTLGYERLDYVIATHYDADHIGGLDDVAKELKVQPTKVFDRGERGPLPQKETAAYRDYATAFAPSRQGPVMLGPGLFQMDSDLNISITSGNGCVFGKGFVGGSHLSENGASLSVAINYGTFDYFVGGDMTGGGGWSGVDIETPTASVVGKVDVLRINHHGSATSSNTEFLSRLDPGVAIISVGTGGQNRARYHHPDRAVLDRLHVRSLDGALAKVYMTTRGETRGGLTARDSGLISVVDGDIAVVSNGAWFLVNGEAFPTDGMKSSITGHVGDRAEVCLPEQAG